MRLFERWLRGLQESIKGDDLSGEGYIHYMDDEVAHDCVAYVAAMRAVCEVAKAFVELCERDDYWKAENDLPDNAYENLQQALQKWEKGEK